MAYINVSCNYQIVSRSTNPHLQLSKTPNTLNPKIPSPSQLNQNHIRVNPKSSNPRQKTYNSRYNSLNKIAQHLNSCLPVEKDVFNILDNNNNNNNNLGTAQDGVIIINSMSNAETARIVLQYFISRCSFSSNVVLYNVTLKVFRKCKDLDSAEQLFDEMLQRGVAPDNVTFSTIIGCARMCAFPGKAVAWFERMPEFGVQPDDATFAVMIDAYGRVGNVDMALALYERARIENWCLGAVTFTTVIRICGTIGNFDQCLAVFRDMKACGINPNLGCYNTLLDAITRAKRPLDIKSIHREILTTRLKPGWATYASLLRAYCKTGCGDEAIDVYKEMKLKKMVLNNVLYNTLLSMCNDIGYVDEAVSIFEDMKMCKESQPDTRSFSLLISILSRNRKVLEAEVVLKEMLQAGFEHDIYVLTNMIKCYGKLNLRDDVARVIDTIMELDLRLDERYCSCVLIVMTHISREDIVKVARCIDKVDMKLGNLVRLVVDCDEEDDVFKNEASKVFADMAGEFRTYCNCLIDLCMHLEMVDKASYLRALL